jgi:hypothetical protein|nr:MAG TPA: hypothetical protein [Caudoviricetes sp.]
MEERTITLNSEELKYTSKIYSLIGRRFLNKYNVDRFYYHLIGKTEVKEFSERLINKISTRLKVYSVEIKETEYPEDSFQTDADSIRTCQIIIINTEVCKNIYYVINFILYPQSISYNMTTGILLRKTTSENLDDNESQETED